jgi:hypothetical protein
MKTKTFFNYRVDEWNDTGDSIVEHLAGADDLFLARAARSNAKWWRRPRRPSA